MEVVGERVDDRDAGVGGHLLDAVLAVGAPHDRGGLRPEDAGRVGDRLAGPDLGEVAVDDERVAAEAGDRARERDLGAQGRLVEDDGHGLRAVERAARERRGLELAGALEDQRLLRRR